MNQLRPALVILMSLTVVTGIAYPLLVTGIAQVVFPAQANGSLVQGDGKAVGSRLIGQPFDDPKYFWSRLSATAPYAYNAGASSGSNLGPLNPEFSCRREGPRRCVARGRSRQLNPDSNRPRDRFGERARSSYRVRRRPSTRSGAWRGPVD